MKPLTQMAASFAKKTYGESFLTGFFTIALTRSVS